MSKEYSKFTFCTEDYKRPSFNNPHEKEVDETEMFEDIGSFIRMLIKNGYQMKISYDGMTVIIEYAYQDEGLSGIRLEWLNSNEYISSYDEDDRV